MTVTKGDTIFLQVNFKKSISVNSSPYGAEVFIGDEFMGKTPFFFEIDEGEKQAITLKKQSYQDTTFIINDADFELEMYDHNMELIKTVETPQI